MTDTRSDAESHLWKIITVVTAIAGVFFLALAWKSKFGEEISNLALGEGLAGSFLLLTAVASEIHAKVFDALSGKSAKHTRFLRIAGGVLAILGFALVTTAGIRSLKNAIPTHNQLATGLAGSFLIMTGILGVQASRLLEAIRSRGASS